MNNHDEFVYKNLSIGDIDCTGSLALFFFGLGIELRTPHVLSLCYTTSLYYDI